MCLGLGCSKKEAPPPAEPAPAAETETTGAGGSETAATLELPPELQAATPPLGDPPSLKLLEPGDKPRRELRWDVDPGLEQTLSIKLEFGIEAVIELLKVQSPDRSTIYKIKLRVKEVLPGGTIRVAFTIDEVNAQYTTRAEPRQAKRLKAAVGTIQGLSGSYSLDPRGSVENVQIELPSGALTEAQDMVDNLKWSLSQMTPSLPKEQVGAGAKWTAHRGVQQSGVHVNQLSTMKIAKLEGTRLDIKTELQQSATPQTVRYPSTSEPLELVTYSAEGSGEVAWDLTELRPRTASMKSAVYKQSVYKKVYQGERAQRANIVSVTTRALTIPGE